MTTTLPTKVYFHQYFRLEIPGDFQEIEEYVRIEIKENGEIDETVGLKINELEFDEVVGLEIVFSDFSEMAGLECPLDNEDYDALADFYDVGTDFL
jgi:hypothetical protein